MTALRRLLLLAGGCALVCGGGLGLVAQSFPTSQGDRLALDSGVVGVETSGAYAWIVPTARGVLLVDTGMDTDAAAILAELARGGRSAADVHTVLLTHGHPDHTGGAGHFPSARFLVGAADVQLATGERSTTSPAGWLFTTFVGRRAVPGAPEPVQDGYAETIDGASVRAIAVPGHTAGSVAWIVDGVLFSGDAALNFGDVIGPSLWPVDEDHGAAEASIGRLAGLGVDVMADGHVGLTRGASDKIDAFVEARR